MIQIQATFSGFSGGAVTLFSAYDPDARVLVVAKEAAYREDRRAGCIVLTNVPGIACDSHFDVDNIRAAVSDYYAMRNGVAADGKSARLVFDPEAMRADPVAAIEQDGVDDSGPKYRIAEGITCAHMATLATCQYAMKADTVERAVKLARRFERLAMGEILTI